MTGLIEGFIEVVFKFITQYYGREKFEIDGRKRNARKFGTIDLIEIDSDNSLISNSRSKDITHLIHSACSALD